MTTPLATLARLTRPRLLVQAARAGCDDYSRIPHLRRLLGPDSVPPGDEALLRLLDLEDGLDRQRRSGDAGYSLVAHVDVMIALMAEARIARAATAGAGVPGPV